MLKFRNILAAIAVLYCVQSWGASLTAGTNTPSAWTIKITNVTHYASAVYCGSNLVWSAETDVLDGLVAWWTLDTDGTDSLGEFDGTITAATNAAGKINGCYGFDGASATIDCSPMTNELSGSYTISAWVFPGAMDGGVHQAWSLRRVAGNYSVCMGVYLGSFSFGRFDGANNPYINAPDSFSTTEWYHIVGVRDVETDTMCLYVNNVCAGSVTDTTVPDAYSGLHIGSQGPDGRYFNGLVDDVRVYNRALTSNEVSVIYNRYK